MEKILGRQGRSSQGGERPEGGKGGKDLNREWGETILGRKGGGGKILGRKGRRSGRKGLRGESPTGKGGKRS